MLDILEAIDKIEQPKAAPKPDFDADEMLQVWAVHYLQIIGEAASRISPEMRVRHPEVPWGHIIGTRHVLVHGYLGHKPQTSPTNRAKRSTKPEQINQWSIPCSNPSPPN